LRDRPISRVMLAVQNSLSLNAETINRYNSLILADRRLVRKPGAQSRNLWSKPEPEVVLSAILDADGSKSLENATKWRRKAIITEVTKVLETA